MWIRRNNDWASLLTLGNATHTSDSRYSVSFQYPNNWRLAISGVRREDHGVYVCQVNTHPPRMLVTNVTVLGNTTCFYEGIKYPGQVQKTYTYNIIYRCRSDLESIYEHVVAIIRKMPRQRALNIATLNCINMRENILCPNFFI